MKKLAIILTGISLVFVVILAAGSVAGSGAPSASSKGSWIPVIAVQLAVASLEEKDVVPSDDLKPHPDVDKCPCKGTGVIKHGDGHETPCPYHGADGRQKRIWGCQCDKPGYYCACAEKYEKCSCTKSTTVSSRPGVSSLRLFFANLFGGRRR
jgi:hypothetical protein